MEQMDLIVTAVKIVSYWRVHLAKRKCMPRTNFFIEFPPCAFGRIFTLFNVSSRKPPLAGAKFCVEGSSNKQ